MHGFPILKMSHLQDYVCLGISAGSMVAYHIWYTYYTYKTPLRTITGWISVVRKQWVSDLRHKKSGGDILAVQTLRNYILVSTFLASIAVTIGFSIISLALNILNSDPATITALVSIDRELIGLKALLVVVCNFVSFFGFTQSIRYFNHIGFAMSVTLESNQVANTEFSHDDPNYLNQSHILDSIGEYLNLGAMCFTIGMRGYYFALPFVFWIFSPFAMLTSSLVLLFAIYVTDRPKRFIARRRDDNISMQRLT